MPANVDFVNLQAPLPAADIIYSSAIKGVLTPLPGATTTTNGFGLNVLNRPYFGFIEEIYSLIPPYDSSDEFFPYMKLVDWTVTEGRGRTAVAVLMFKGIRDGNIPPESVEGGFNQASVQLSTIRGRGDYATSGMIDLGLGNLAGGTGVDGKNANKILQLPYIAQQQESFFQATLAQLATEESGEVSVSYKSPTTTWMYVTQKEPKKPKHIGELLATEGDFDVDDIQPASFQGRPVCNREVRTVRFSKRRQGSWWECIEVNQGVLSNLKVTMRGIRGNVPVKRKGSLHNTR